MQCPTIDESLSSQPVAPAAAATGGLGWRGRLAESFRSRVIHDDRGDDRGDQGDTPSAVWDTRCPGATMSSRPLAADPVTSPDEVVGSMDVIETSPDSDLADALRAGNGRAIARLFDLYGAHVERVLIRTVGRDAEMEDMIQDVFLGAYRSGPNYQGNDAQLKAWISRIAVFTARGYLRKRKRRWWLRSADPVEMPEQSSREPSPHTSEVLRRTYAALDQMDADLRIPFALRELEAMELTEIAEACECSVSTVKRRLAAARKAFERLAKKDPILRDWLEDEN